MIPGTAYTPFYALLFTGTWLLSTRVAVFTVRHYLYVCVCAREIVFVQMTARAHTSHNWTAAHFKHGK